MARTNPHADRTVAPQDFLACLQYFLTPALWRQAHRALRRWSGRRWQPRALLLVLFTLTWCWGDSLPERFETARAFYVACGQRRRRPGRTAEGFQKALTRVPAAALRAVAGLVGARVRAVFADRLEVDGFVPLGCDGTGVACPRSAELERWLTPGDPDRHAPQVGVTALVHLSLGLLWAWRLGKGTGQERGHLRQLLASLPPAALVVADAGFVGYDLMRALEAAGVAFWIRVGSEAPLYAPTRLARSRFQDGLIDYWPRQAQRRKQPPLGLRLLHVRGRKAHIWLLTNVLDPVRLPRRTAGRFYRLRWENEGLFHTDKRTLGKVKWCSRTVAGVHGEAEGSRLALQLLLAQGARALPAGGVRRRPSARQVLLAIRAELRDVAGSYLGQRPRRRYAERLRQARGDRRRRRVQKVRRPWPRRVEHRPPKPPQILKMATDLKTLKAKTLAAVQTG